MDSMNHTNNEDHSGQPFGGPRSEVFRDICAQSGVSQDPAGRLAEIAKIAVLLTSSGHPCLPDMDKAAETGAASSSIAGPTP